METIFKPTIYEILDVKRTATLEGTLKALQKGYKKKVLSCHPDKGNIGGGEKMKILNNIKDFLNRSDSLSLLGNYNSSLEEFEEHGNLNQAFLYFEDSYMKSINRQKKFDLCDDIVRLLEFLQETKATEHEIKTQITLLRCDLKRQQEEKLQEVNEIGEIDAVLESEEIAEIAHRLTTLRRELKLQQEKKNKKKKEVNELKENLEKIEEGEREKENKNKKRKREGKQKQEEEDVLKKKK